MERSSPLLHRRRRHATSRTAALVALALVCALPAAGHMLVRGNPLSELAAGSPTAVIGVVASRFAAPDGPSVVVRVERGVLGDIVAGTFRFTLASHHPAEFPLGQRVLVFLTRAEPPWVSAQSAKDVVAMPDSPTQVQAIVDAVHAYAALGDVPEPAPRLAALKALSIGHLESPSAALRREALLDLLATGRRVPLDGNDVARLTSIAERPHVPATLGPGLVMLLASAPSHAHSALSRLAEHGGSAQVRALAAQALERRHTRRRPASTAPAASPHSNGRES